MKVNIDWLGKKYIGKTIEIDQKYFNRIINQKALNLIFTQNIVDEWYNDNIVFFDRNDVKMTPKTASASMSVATFASENFSFCVVNRKYVEDLLTNV